MRLFLLPFLKLCDMLSVYLGGILMVNISSFTKAEFEYIRENANFTERELQLYELRNKQYTYEMCAELMNMSVSTIKRIAHQVDRKINRVIQ